MRLVLLSDPPLSQQYSGSSTIGAAQIDLDRLVVSNVLQPECVQELAAVAERRKLENEKREFG